MSDVEIAVYCDECRQRVHEASPENTTDMPLVGASNKVIELPTRWVMQPCKHVGTFTVVGRPLIVDARVDLLDGTSSETKARLVDVHHGIAEYRVDVENMGDVRGVHLALLPAFSRCVIGPRESDD